ncbi:MAG: ABC transporter permease [Desulforhopalus sp.]
MQQNFPGRQLNILDYALKGLRRKLLKNIAIFCIFTFVIFLLSSFQLLGKAFVEAAERLLQTVPDITVQQMSAGRQVALDGAVAYEFTDIFGIKKMNKRIWGYYFDESNGANYTVIGMDRRPEDLQASGWVGLAKGRLPEPDMPGEVVVSTRVAGLLALGDRQYFSLFRPDLTLRSFKVVGFFNRNWDIVTADVILMSLADARDLFAIPEGYITDLLVYVANRHEIETIAAKISEILPGSRVITRNQILKTYKVVFSWRSGLGTICLLTALATFVILAWDKASGLSGEEVREVGILKLLGWQTSDIIALRFCESGTVGIFAFSTGYLLGWVHVAVFGGGLFKPIFLGWSILRPDIQVVPGFAFGDMLLVFSISVIPYLCATAVPAWRAAVIRAETVI